MPTFVLTSGKKVKAVRKIPRGNLDLDEMRIVREAYARLDNLKPEKCMKESKRWLDKAQNKLSGFAILAYSEIAYSAAVIAYDYEQKKLQTRNRIEPTYLEASLQKLKCYILMAISYGRRDVKELVRTSRGAAAHSTLDAEDVTMYREYCLERLNAMIQIAFDALNFKIAFGSPIYPLETLGKAVFDNKERHAEEVMTEIKRFLQACSNTENLAFLLRELPERMEGVYEEINNRGMEQLEEALCPCFKEMLSLAKAELTKLQVAPALLQNKLGHEMREEIPLSSIYEALNKLALFSSADQEREGAKNQKSASEIHQLIVEYQA